MDISSIRNSSGYIKIAAMDHRDSLKKSLDEDLFPAYKDLLTTTFAPYSTAILVDPEFGKQAIESAKLANIGILLSREETGYTEEESGRKTTLYKKFTAQVLKEMGATGVKLLLYYSHEAANAKEQIDLAKQVHEECKMVDLPLLIEPITYAVQGIEYHKGDSIVRATQDLRDHCEVLKLEFPVDMSTENADIEAAIPYLQTISEEAQKPWVLLSRGMEFQLYKKAVRASKDAGCSGFAVGRAVWQEISEMHSWEEIKAFIETTAKSRMEELSAIFE